MGEGSEEEPVGTALCAGNERVQGCPVSKPSCLPNKGAECAEVLSHRTAIIWVPLFLTTAVVSRL